MFAVIYSKNTGRIRSIIKPDKDSDLNSILTLDGEAYSIFDDKDYVILPDLQELLNKRTGLQPKDGDDTYDVVNDKGEVVSSVIADPLIDKVEGHTLVKKVITIDDIII